MRPHVMPAPSTLLKSFAITSSRLAWSSAFRATQPRSLKVPPQPIHFCSTALESTVIVADVPPGVIVPLVFQKSPSDVVINAGFGIGSPSVVTLPPVPVLPPPVPVLPPPVPVLPPPVPVLPPPVPTALPPTPGVEPVPVPPPEPGTPPAPLPSGLGVLEQPKEKISPLKRPNPRVDAAARFSFFIEIFLALQAR